jgi:hypothetical protein
MKRDKKRTVERSGVVRVGSGLAIGSAPALFGFGASWGRWAVGSRAGREAVLRLDAWPLVISAKLLAIALLFSLLSIHSGLGPKP